MERTLIFWLDGPPVCCKGVFDAVSNLWKGNVYYILTRKIDENRAMIVNNDKADNCRAKYIILTQMSEPEKYAVKFLKDHIDDIHVFNGYMSNCSKYLNLLLEMNNKAKTIIWAERPGYRGSEKRGMKKWLIDNLYLIRHSRFAVKYRNKVSAMLPIGRKGVSGYERCGWKTNSLFPWLYLPEMNESVFPKYEHSETVKFIYLGRFSALGKGTDILIDACRKLKRNNYKLTMVGGYGDYKDQTLAYIEQNPNLEFGGTWKIDEACDRLSEYDVCIVPSRFEGWNVTVNEALMAGIGCIVTDEAVSDELVTASKAGLVVKADDSSALAEAMEKVMKDPNLVSVWKQNAVGYRPKMTANACADYFISILNYLFSDEKSGRPIPPWQG